MQSLDRLMFIAWFTPVDNGWGAPLLFTGAPGQTKTARMAALARRFNQRFLHLSPAQKGEGYFGVVPVPELDNDLGSVLGFPANRAIARMQKIERGLLLVDEVRTAPGIVRPALLGLLQERTFGDMDLVPGIRIFGASNSARDAVNGKPLSAPEANRVVHIPWPTITPEMMAEYMDASSSEAPFAMRREPSLEYNQWLKIEEDVIKHRPAERARAGTEIFRAFIPKYDTAKGSALSKQPEPGTPAVDGPWPSPRSWTLVANILSAYRSLRACGHIRFDGPDCDDPDLATLIRGCVGGIGGEFLEWLRSQDLPDYADWLDGRLTGSNAVVFEPGRDDRAYVIFAGAATHVLTLEPGPIRKRRAKAFFSECEKAAGELGFEVVMAGAKLIIRQNTDSGNMEDMSDKSAAVFLKRYRDDVAAINKGE